MITYHDSTYFKMVFNARRRQLFFPIRSGDNVCIVQDHKGRENSRWYVVYITKKMCVLRSLRLWQKDVIPPLYLHHYSLLFLMVVTNHMGAGFLGEFAGHIEGDLIEI